MKEEQLLVVKFHRFYNSLPKGRDSQARILKIVSSNDGISQRRLQEIVGIKPGSLSEVLLKLEKLGYIKRGIDPDDKRRQVVCITDEGRKAFEDIHAEREKESEHIFDSLSQDEKGQLLSILNKLLGEKAHDKERFHKHD